MYLAQLNIAKPLYPIDSIEMKSFVDQIAHVNALAEAASGFVWRLQDENGDGALDQIIFDDPTLIVNMSLWESGDQLKDYVYGVADHRRALSDRRQWFAQPEMAMTVMWWVESGDIPTLEEAEKRLIHLREHGPSAYAFPFRFPIDPAFSPLA